MKIELNIKALTLEQLDELSTIVYAEKKERIRRFINTFPKPNIDYTKNRVENMKRYRDANKCDLLVAREVIEHYYDTQMVNN